MRHIFIIICILSLCSCSSGSIREYPSDWPARPVMSSDCAEVSGKYADAAPFFPGGSPPGAQIFMLNDHADISKLRLNDNTVNSRELLVHFDAERTLHIDYLINAGSVLSRTFTPSDYVCGKGGLRLSIYNRTGEQVYDMFPNRGSTSETLLIFRVSDYLYVEFTSDTKAAFYHVIPSTSHSEWWVRFLAR